MKIEDNIITCEVVDKNGKSLGIKRIKKEDIKKWFIEIKSKRGWKVKEITFPGLNLEEI